MNSLDRFLPAYDVAARYAVTVDAEAAAVDRALREVTFADVPFVRALLFARGLGRGRSDETVIAALGRLARVLEDVPGEGVVFSLTGQFWRLRGRGRGPAATAVVDFRAGPGRLTTETRVHLPDPSARRKFARYWRVVGPFSGLIRILVLRAAKRRAERRT